MQSAIELDKVDLVCAETVKSKPTVNYSGFITYSNTIDFSGKWFDNSGYIITQWINFERTGFIMDKKIGKNQKSDPGWINCGKDDILKVQGKLVALIGNKAKKNP